MSLSLVPPAAPKYFAVKSDAGYLSNWGLTWSWMRSDTGFIPGVVFTGTLQEAQTAALVHGGEVVGANPDARGRLVEVALGAALPVERDSEGRFHHTGAWERPCRCGHSLGVHTAARVEGKRPCISSDFGGPDCDCDTFRPKR